MCFMNEEEKNCFDKCKVPIEIHILFLGVYFCSALTHIDSQGPSIFVVLPFFLSFDILSNFINDIPFYFYLVS